MQMRITFENSSINTSDAIAVLKGADGTAKEEVGLSPGQRGALDLGTGDTIEIQRKA